MKTKIALTVAIVIAVGAVAAWQEEKPKACTVFQSCSLRGSPEIIVLPALKGDAFGKTELSVQELAIEVRRLLARWNIPVRTTELEYGGWCKRVKLHIAVSADEVTLEDGTRRGEYYWSSTCSAWQCVRPWRDKSIIITGATTWRTESRVGYCASERDLKREIHDVVQEQVTCFIKAYSEANPNLDGETAPP